MNQDPIRYILFRFRFNAVHIPGGTLAIFSLKEKEVQGNFYLFSTFTSIF